MQSKVDTREQELDVARASRTEAEQELLKVTNEMRKLQVSCSVRPYVMPCGDGKKKEQGVPYC